MIVAPDGHDEDEILDVIRALQAFGIKVRVLPCLLEVAGSSSAFTRSTGSRCWAYDRLGSRSLPRAGEGP